MLQFRAGFEIKSEYVNLWLEAERIEENSEDVFAGVRQYSAHNVAFALDAWKRYMTGESTNQ